MKDYKVWSVHIFILGFHFHPKGQDILGLMIVDGQLNLGQLETACLSCPAAGPP